MAHVVAAAPDSRYVVVAPRGGENRLPDWHSRQDAAATLWFAGAPDAYITRALDPNPKLGPVDNRLYY